MSSPATRQSALLLLAAKLRVDMRHAGDVAGHRDDTPLHRAADAHLASMVLALRAAFNVARKAIKTSLLHSDSTQEDAERAVAGVSAALHAALLKVLPPVLVKTFVAGANAGVGMLPRKLKAAKMRTLADPPFDIRFDATSPEAIAWAKAHASELAKNLSETSRDDIKQAIADALDGDGIDSAYDTILEAVGSDVRAEMIARTEVMDSANSGLLASWGAAQDAGLLGEGAQKEFIATSGACDDCDEMDGEVVGIDEDFSSGDDSPPIHPNCRCTMGIAAGDSTE